MSTLKKSAATRLSACADRNCFHGICDRRPAGGILALSSTDLIVVAATIQDLTLYRRRLTAA